MDPKEPFCSFTYNQRGYRRAGDGCFLSNFTQEIVNSCPGGAIAVILPFAHRGATWRGGSGVALGSASPGSMTPLLCFLLCKSG